MKLALRKLILILAPLLLAAGWFGTASASGEVYQWADSAGNAITAHGGVYPDGVTLTRSVDSDPVEFSATIPDNCHITLTLARTDLGREGANALFNDQPAGCAKAADPQVVVTAAAKDCDGGNLSYILCPVYELGINTIRNIEHDFIIPFLKITPLSVDAGYTPHKIWDSFRTLADVAFVVIFLVIVFANTFSLSLDTYSLKRLLPRLAVAAIGVQFSYILVALGIDLANVVGAGVGELALAPIRGQTTATIDNVIGSVGIAGGLTAAVALAGGILSGTILLTLLAAFLGILLVFLILVFRQIAIMFLLIIAPLAFVAWILPNTEHYFHHWRHNLMRLLLMYPLVVLLFASGQIFGAAINAGAGSGWGNGSLRSLISVLANVLPLFLLPATFALAGELMLRATAAFRVMHGATRLAATNAGAVQRLRDRTNQRKVELAAGEGVNILGYKAFSGPLSHVGELAGRGFFESVTRVSPRGNNLSNVRAMAAFAKERSQWSKRLEEEEFTFESHQALSRGEGWVQKELADLKRKRSAAPAAQQQSYTDAIDELTRGNTLAKQYRRVSAARAAAAIYLGKAGFADNDDRKALLGYIHQSGTGKLISRQVWGTAKEGSRKTNVHIPHTDVFSGNIDHIGMRKFVMKKGQIVWSEYTEDAYKEMHQDGTLAEMLKTGAGRRTMAGLMGAGGPQVGAAQQNVIRDALADLGITDAQLFVNTKGQSASHLGP